MSKAGKIIGGIVVFIIGAIVIGLLKGSLGGLPAMGIMLLFLYVFSRVTGLNTGFGGKDKSTSKEILPKTTDMPQYCPKCGKGYDETWKVCLSCSSQLVNSKTHC